MRTFKRSQAKYVKQSYQTTNWPEYEAGLRQRGSLTVWISEDELRGWGPPERGRQKPGGQQRYSDHAIETALMNMLFNGQIRGMSPRLVPEQTGMTPGWEEKHFDASVRQGQLRLVVSPDGGTLYVAHKDGDDLAVYAIEQATGQLTVLQQPAAGLSPEALTLTSVIR